MSEKVVWESAVEGLYLKALGGQLTPALKAELKACGLDLDKKLPPGLPRAAWFASLAITARHLYPTLTRAEGVRELGRQTVDGIAKTVWGKALAPAVTLLGPARLLARVPGQMKATNNYATGVITEKTSTSFVLEVDDAGDAPEMMQGSLERLATWAGAQAVEVLLEPLDAPRVRYRMRWR